MADSREGINPRYGLSIDAFLFTATKKNFIIKTKTNKEKTYEK